MTTATETIVAKLSEIENELASLAQTNRQSDAGREFALARTATEDAIMRTNRGFAIVHDTFSVADVEAQASES